MKLRVNGIGWKIEIDYDYELDGDKICIKKNDFIKMLNVLATTHDTVSGGFQFTFEDENRQNC